MRIDYPRCCRLDIHKRSMSACLLIPGKDGGTQPVKTEEHNKTYDDRHGDSGSA
jgi:hypothetical protein